MQIQAASIGEAVPRGNFDAAIQSVFDSAVNMRLLDEDRLITLLVSNGYELPQGIRVTKRDAPLQTLTPGLGAAARGGILRFDSSPLTVDLRGASVWRCRIREFHVNTASLEESWIYAWQLLETTQRQKNADIVCEDLFRPGAGSALSLRVSAPVRDLVAAASRNDVEGAIQAAQGMIGLGPGATPSGDDILTGFLAALWSVADEEPSQLSFIRSFGDALMGIANKTNEISRTYLYHAAHGQFSSSLTSLVGAFAGFGNLEETARAAMRVGHSSGMDSVTGLLVGLCVWNHLVPAAVPGGGDAALSI
jgi:hypothetical protein